MQARDQSLTREPTLVGIEDWWQQLEWIGGEGLPGQACRAHETVFGNRTVAYRCGCGVTALGKVPYERVDGTTGSVTLCAVCDAATEMPRFAE